MSSTTQVERSPAVFLDRDGTLNRERGFVSTAEELELLPGVPEALRRLQAAGFVLVVVTNQSGIARGLYSEATLAHIHATLHARLQRRPRAYLHCPHHPDAAGPFGGGCTCRKPLAGLLHQALDLLPIRLEGSFLVGDSARDVAMARGLPIRTVLVASGKPLDSACVADHRAADLAAATDWILAQRR